jgi:SAM-dependent methyltransferase
MFETITHCPVCQSTHFRPYLICKDYTTSGEEFQIMVCEHCGFKCTNPRPDEANIGKYYQAQDYISHSNTKRGLINFLYHWIRWFVLGKKIKLINLLAGNSSKKLLDYGCGTGYFLHASQKSGWQVQGIEPDAGARKIAQELTNTEVLSDIFDSKLNGQSFQIITLWHVLEHVHRLRETLQRLKDLLAQDGTLLIAVPNHTSWDGQHYGEYWAGYDVPRHLHHFDPMTLNFMMRGMGFEYIEKKPMYFDAYYISLLSEKYKNGKTNYWRAFWNGWKSNAVAKKNDDNYSSLIYIFRKKQAK